MYRLNYEKTRKFFELNTNQDFNTSSAFASTKKRDEVPSVVWAMSKQQEQLDNSARVGSCLRL